jgi:hypothetical protein
MTPAERVAAFWRGEEPDHIPYCVNARMWKRSDPHNPAWRSLFRMGLGVNYTVRTFSESRNHVAETKEVFAENNCSYERTVLRTPVGEIYKIDRIAYNRYNERDAWTQKHWIENLHDYRVMVYILENTSIEPDFANFHAQQERIKSEVGENGIVRIGIGRTPLQSIIVDLLGLENFGFHLCDYYEQLMKLYEALLRNFSRKAEYAASGPGTFIWLLENFSSDTVGPQRYEDLILNVYRKHFPAFHTAGKVVGVHYDGKLKACKELIADAPIDVIESLTPPPEGDMSLEECRDAWPDKSLWSNINVSAYSLDRDRLIRLVMENTEKASVNGRRLAFELSEDLPKNWEESVPIVLRALMQS